MMISILEKKVELRRYVPSQDRPAWLPVKDEHTFDTFRRPDLHLYPELRSKFRGLPMTPELGAVERPLLIIHNKHTIEWSAGPVNHIPVAVLPRRATSACLRSFYPDPGFIARKVRRMRAVRVGVSRPGAGISG
jgi:hypothetical protein